MKTLYSARGKTAARKLLAADRGQILRILKKVGTFTGAEVRMAMEIIDSCLFDEDDEYRFKVAVDCEDRVMGFLCYGRADLSRSYWELYWMAVDPACQRMHVGELLMKAMESDIMSKKGTNLLIETSSKDIYEAARRFYRRMGYNELLVQKDFYGAGEDRITYEKIFETSMNELYLPGIGGRVFQRRWSQK